MRIIALLLGLCVAGCLAPVGVDRKSLPKDAAQTCASHCSTIGMALNSVVIMADNVGCVCSAGPPPPGSGASAGGMVALLMVEEQPKRSKSDQPHHSPSSPSPTR